MRINKLISVFLLAVLMGFSSQSFAILATMDAEGSVSYYTYSGDVDPFSGSISIGDTFSSMTVLDPDTANDRDDLEGIGTYVWAGDVFETAALVGSNVFSTQSTQVRILNDYNGYLDQYRIDSWGTYNGQHLLFNIILQDNTGTVFDSDEFVLEPSLYGFDDFSRAYFLIRSYDEQYNLNFTIRGDLTSFVDPMCIDNECIRTVPEPSTIFLLGLGLVAVFFASNGYRREDKFTA